EAERERFLLVAGEQKAPPVSRPQRWFPNVGLEDRPAQTRAPAVDGLGIARCAEVRIVLVLLEIDLTGTAADVARAYGLLARFEGAAVGGGEFVERLAYHRSHSRRVMNAFGGRSNRGSSKGCKPARSRICIIASPTRRRTRKRVLSSAVHQLSTRTRSIRAGPDSKVVASRSATRAASAGPCGPASAMASCSRCSCSQCRSCASRSASAFSCARARRVSAARRRALTGAGICRSARSRKAFMA